MLLFEINSINAGLCFVGLESCPSSKYREESVYPVRGIVFDGISASPSFHRGYRGWNDMKWPVENELGFKN